MVQDWYLDSATGLPARVEYRVPDERDAARYTTLILSYSDYRQIQGALFPWLLQMKVKPISMPGANLEIGGATTYRVTTLTTDGVSDSEFDLPGGDE